MKREAYKQMTKRLRGKTKSDFTKCIMISFNPILKSHWIYKEFFHHWRDDSTHYEDENLSILKTTYKDNMFLTEDDRKQLENESDPYYYQVYTLGNFGILGHVIFKNYRVEDLSDRIPQFDNIFYGMDFGYNDPTAIIKVHYDKKRKKIYILDEVYQQYMTDDELLTICREFIGNNYVTCDSAEPKTIDFLASNGIKAIPAVKGADSIMRGIRWLQGFEIIIDVHCQNFKNNIETLHFMEDKYGNVLDKPASGDDHLCHDALRYALESEILEAEVTAGKRI